MMAPSTGTADNPFTISDSEDERDDVVAREESPDIKVEDEDEEDQDYCNEFAGEDSPDTNTPATLPIFFSSTTTATANDTLQDLYDRE